MEHLVLKVLSFDVACPTVNVFCERYLHNLGFSESDEAFSLAMVSWFDIPFIMQKASYNIFVSANC